MLHVSGQECVWLLPLTLLCTVCAVGLGSSLYYQESRRGGAEHACSGLSGDQYLEVGAVEELVEAWQFVHVQVVM